MKILVFCLVIAGLTVGCSSSKKASDGSAESKASEAAGKMTKSGKATKSTKMAKTKASDVICTMKKDVRSLKVVSKDPKGCELIYGKHGSEKAVAQSAHGTGHCNKVQSSMKGNLEKAGFSCE